LITCRVNPPHVRDFIVAPPDGELARNGLPSRWVIRRLGVVVAILVVVVDVLYVRYIVFVQGATSDQPWRVPFVASYLAAIAICALLSATLPAGSWRLALIGAATAGLLVLGFFGLFSIGLPLFLMGLVAVGILVGQITRAQSRRAAAGVSIAGILAAVVVLMAGFEITARIIACPPGAVSGGGSGGGFLTGSYSYTCQNGRAIVNFGQ
jgi:hypothetical protein